MELLIDLLDFLFEHLLQLLSLDPHCLLRLDHLEIALLDLIILFLDLEDLIEEKII